MIKNIHYKLWNTFQNQLILEKNLHISWILSKTWIVKCICCIVTYRLKDTYLVAAHDGSPYQNAKIVLRIQVIKFKWTGISPDFNPIGNLSNYLKWNIVNRHPASIKMLVDLSRISGTTGLSTEYLRIA